MSEDPAAKRAVKIERIAAKRRADLRRGGDAQRGKRPAVNSPENKRLLRKIADDEKEHGRLLKNIAKTEKQLAKWGGGTVDRIEANSRQWEAEFANYERLIRWAIRAGLMWHPSVRAWLADQRSLNEKDKLRVLRLGLERDVKPTMSRPNFWVKYWSITFIEKPKPDGVIRTYEEVRRALIKKLESGQPDKYCELSADDVAKVRKHLRSRQSFHQLLCRLQVIQAGDRN